MRILLCDDHPVFGMGLTRVLSALQPSADIQRIASLTELRSHLGRPGWVADLLVLDRTLPDGDGLTALPLTAPWDATSVVIVSAHAEAATISQALELGAHGYIPKSSSLAVMEHAFKLVFDGGRYLPPELLQPVDTSPATPQALTPRQRDIADLLTRGLSNREICGVLGVTENTVKAHLKAIFRALDVTNRTEAAVLWSRKTGV